MNAVKTIKKVILNACVIYTIMLTAVYTLGAFVNSSWIPTVRMVYSCLAFSIILSALNSFLFSDMLVFALRLLIHFISSSVIFYVLYIVWGGYKSNGGSTLTALLVFVFVYVLCAAIVGIFKYLFPDKKSNDKQINEYKPIFSGSDNGNKTKK